MLPAPTIAEVTRLPRVTYDPAAVLDLAIDFETASEIDIKKSGAWAYAEGRSTEVLCLCWWDGQQAGEWYPGAELPSWVLTGRAPDGRPIRLLPFNAEFELAVWIFQMWAKHGAAPPSAFIWQDVAGLAGFLQLGRSLEQVAIANGGSKKASDLGKRALEVLSFKGRNRHFKRDQQLAAWYDLLEYCHADNVAAFDVWSKWHVSWPARQQQVYECNLRINARGVPIDVESAMRLADVCTIAEKQFKRVYLDPLIGSPAKIKALLGAQGIEVDDVRASTLERLLEDDEEDVPDDLRAVINDRLAIAKASTKKIVRMLDSVSSDGRLRGMHRYHAARTGRFAGQGVQTQNLVRDTEKDAHAIFLKLREKLAVEIAGEWKHEALAKTSRLIRPLIMAERGKKLIAADYSAIEACGVAWAAGAGKLLERFRSGEDVYLKTASEDIYPGMLPPDASEKTHPFERFLGKQCVLGCGYGCGPAKFRTMCAKLGRDIDSDLAVQAVNTFRRVTAPEVPKLWSEIEDAMLEALACEVPTPFSFAGGKGAFVFLPASRELLMLLPCGRPLIYRQVKVTKMPTAHKGLDGQPVTKDVVSYRPPFGGDHRTGMADMIFRVCGKLEIEPQPWLQQLPADHSERVALWGGLLLENFVQGFCVDVLTDSLIGLEEAGFEVVMHTHDEAVMMVAEEHVDWAIPEIAKIMTVTARQPWSEGLPLKCKPTASVRYKG